jgi:hypothetical protein
MKWLEIKEEHKKYHIRAEKLSKGSVEDKEILRAIQEVDSRYLPICEKTLKVLEFCTPYYEYVGIRHYTPVSFYYDWGSSFSAFGQPFGITCRKDYNNPKIDKSGDHDDWPAIWRACDLVNIGSCGNSHQKQINGELTTGLYRNIDGKWYIKID